MIQFNPFILISPSEQAQQVLQRLSGKKDLELRNTSYSTLIPGELREQEDVHRTLPGGSRSEVQDQVRHLHPSAIHQREWGAEEKTRR